MNRRHLVTPATPNLTSGDDSAAGLCLDNPAPFDVLIDTIRGPEHQAAIREAWAVCRDCPIMARCHADNADEDWVKALEGRLVRPGPRPRFDRACSRCEVPIVGSGQRVRPEGFAVHGGRGLCMACYSKAKRDERKRRAVA